MSPRLEAAARYHRRYRYFLERAKHWQGHTAEFALMMARAERCYTAAVVELHPEKAVEAKA